jgi:hypothetical protein
MRKRANKNPATVHSQPRGEAKMNKLVKLKRARGSLLRLIRTGLTPAPPGYMTQADYEREDEESGKRAALLRRLARK